MRLPCLQGEGTCRTAQSQPWTALQVPAQAPFEPWPRQVPPPRPPESRPDPLALWPPLETLTLTWPLGETRPETLTAPPPRYVTAPPRIITPYR